MKRALAMACVSCFAAATCCLAQFVIKGPMDIVPIDGWRNPEMRAYTADLIVVGKITAISAPKDIELTLPFREKAGTWSFVTYSVTVEQVIASRKLPADGSSAKPCDALAKDAALGVLTSADAVADDKPIQFKGLPIRHDAAPETGKSYLLFLYRLNGRTEYYLPANDGYWENVDDARIKDIRDYLDTSKWPWGKAESGVQIALFGPSEAEMRGGSVPMNVAVALRNASDKPISIDLNSTNRPLSLTATGADGKTASIELYSRAVRPVPAGGWFRKLEPGEAVFIKPAGLATEMMLVKAAIGEGKWTLTAQFINTAPVELDRLRVGAWKGKAQSMPVEVDVRPEEVRPPGGA